METNQNQTKEILSAEKSLSLYKDGYRDLLNKDGFTLQDCKEWIKHKQHSTSVYIKCNTAPEWECKTLQFPEETNPYNIIRSIIDQYYNRESEMAWNMCGGKDAERECARLKEANIKLNRHITELDKMNSGCNNKRFEAFNTFIECYELDEVIEGCMELMRNYISLHDPLTQSVNTEDISLLSDLHLMFLTIKKQE